MAASHDGKTSVTGIEVVVKLKRNVDTTADVNPAIPESAYTSAHES
eukprot:COSAG01_NODE_23336_length_819_cov_0.747222_1_plen_45_part_10